MSSKKLAPIALFFCLALIAGIFIGEVFSTRLRHAHAVEISKQTIAVQQYLEAHPEAWSTISEGLGLIKGKFYHILVVRWSYPPRAIEVIIDKPNLTVLETRDVWIGWK
jgi:hypothetical protein